MGTGGSVSRRLLECGTHLVCVTGQFSDQDLKFMCISFVFVRVSAHNVHLEVEYTRVENINNRTFGMTGDSQWFHFPVFRVPVFSIIKRTI